MYDRVLTNIYTPVGTRQSFLSKVGLHQGSTLSPFIFTVIMEEISKSIWETVPWCVLFADDIVLVTETKEEVISELEEWKEALEGKGLRISCTKTEYLRCNFSGDRIDRGARGDHRGEVVVCTSKFKHLGSVINKEIDGTLLIVYKQVGLSGEQQPGCFVIKSSQRD